MRVLELNGVIEKISKSRRLVEGKFTTKSTASNVVQTIDIPYDGNGYPVAALVVVDDGIGDLGTKDWYASAQRYAVIKWSMLKTDMDLAPSYAATVEDSDRGNSTSFYKVTTSAGVSASNSVTGDQVFSSNSPLSTALGCIKFSSANIMNVYVSALTYGLLPEKNYRYYIIYS